MVCFSYVLQEGEMFGERRDRSVLLDDVTVTLSLDSLRQVGLWGKKCEKLEIFP